MSGAVIRLPLEASGLAPEDQQMVGVVDVGHGHRGPAAEHQSAGHLLWELVDGARRIDVARREGAQEHLAVEQVREIVGIGVAEVHRHRVAVGGQDRRQTLVDERERLVPARLAKPVASRISGVRMRSGSSCSCAQRRPLGTDEAVAEDVVGVAADRDDPLALQLDLQAAGRLTQRTGAQTRCEPPLEAIRRHLTGPPADRPLPGRFVPARTLPPP